MRPSLWPVGKGKGLHRCNPLNVWRARQDESGHWSEVVALL